MNAPDCRAAIREDLKAYTDGEIRNPLRRRAIRQHLAACPACREELTMLETISRELKASENGHASDPLSAPLRARLLDAVARDEDDAPNFVDARPLWQRSPKLVFGGGGAMLAASAAAFFVLYGGGVPHPTASADESASAPAASQATASVGAGAPMAGSASSGMAGLSAPPAAPQVQMKAMSATAAVSAAAPMSVTGVIDGPVRAGSPVGFAGVHANAKMARSSYYSDPGRQVHRDASIGLEVPDIEAASDRIEDAAKASGGYVASDNLTTDSGSGVKSADIVLKVPEKDTRDMLTTIAKVGNVVAKNMSSEDITDQVDNATDGEQALIDRVTSLQDELHGQHFSDRVRMLKESQLQSAQRDLAQMRGQLGSLRKQAAMATIDVTLTEPAKRPTATPTPSPFWNGMHDSNESAMLAFQAAIRVPLLLAIWVVALSPIWVPLLIAYRYYAKKSAERR